MMSVLYNQFLNSIKMLIESSLPTKTVKIGPRDPSYLSPAIKVLLAKRNKLRRKGCNVEADSIAVKINGMISKNREFCLSKMSESFKKELWKLLVAERNIIELLLMVSL